MSKTFVKDDSDQVFLPYIGIRVWKTDRKAKCKRCGKEIRPGQKRVRVHTSYNYPANVCMKCGRAFSRNLNKILGCAALRGC